jgi:branched-chain amino acid transport system permease protein
VELTALSECLATPSCVVFQTVGGLKIGMLLFLVASGLTLIFGVLGVINFAHGTFYMLGAYLAHTAIALSGSFTVGVIAAALGTAVIGVAFERGFLSRIYRADVLVQLLVCYAFILIVDDLVIIIWGDEFLSSLGVPDLFKVRPLFFAGAIVPPFHLFLIGASVAVAVILWLIMRRTRFGKIVRAAAHNPQMVSALGINTTLVYAGVFALGSLLAGLGGALAASERSISSGMGFSIVIESFIVTVIGGMGSIGGAFVAAILIGMARSFGAIGFPLFTDGLMFLVMCLVLILRPQGLFGQAES